jgi:hypothetical protein
MPGLRGFQVPGHQATCPTADFAVWGRSFSVHAHCDILERNREAIRFSAIAAWALLALFIVLAA